MEPNKQIIDYDSYDIELEKSLFKSFMESKQYRVPPEFLQAFKVGDIIEIYSFPDHKQIFANKEFLRLSSYSLEQMQSTPFQKLFWRESEVQQQLLQRAIQIVEEKAAHPWGLPPHDLVEALHPRRRTFEMHMGWIAPVYDNQDNIVGWASTLKVEYVFEWPASTDID